MANEPELLLAYYGDDFTGSTDALEFLSRAGIKTVLFIEPPTPAQLARYKGLQAIGVAGMTRSMPPAEMEQTLRPAFEALKHLGVPHVHYKVCSTFDSSPQIGSIGKAIDVGALVFEAAFVPLLVAAPALGRYCAFGNLFARMGIGSAGQTFRLDRHPSMSHHPVTPMDEGDLRVHLSKQTSKPIGLIDIIDIAQSETHHQTKLQTELDAGKQVILFDALYRKQLLPIAKLIDQYASKSKPLFSVGSSGIEMALGNYWTEQGIAKPKTEWAPAGRAENMLVVSGSCSPVTAKQIEYAVAHGFAAIALDTVALAETMTAHISSSTIIEKYINDTVTLIKKGTPVIIHTSLGANDARIEKTYNALAKTAMSRQDILSKTAQIYGLALGTIAIGVASQTKLQRLIIAGGDTSSFVARTMGIEAVEMIAPVSPGAPLCKAHAPGSAVNGIEVNFKGGQVGAENYFELVLNGQTTT
jgi:uncharacterized protein YgbK (DUF1537 family)